MSATGPNRSSDRPSGRRNGSLAIYRLRRVPGPPRTARVSAADRGGVKRYATLTAIPQASLKNFGANLSAAELGELYKAVSANRLEGVVKIINHSFSREILLPEKLVWESPKYRLERDASAGIKAVQTAGSGTFAKSSRFSYLALGTVAAGIFLAGSFLILGVWLFRKKRRKS